MKLVFAFLFFILTFSSLLASAKIEVLFHPTDPTLRKIGSWIKNAEQTIDISMYDMETGPNSPVIAALMDARVQEKLASQQLSIRLLFEGYGTPEARARKMSELESLGVDVRELTTSKKLHHKFAVIDPASANPRVITGSANWSLSSYRNYDENILFLEQELNATANYQSEFERLWSHSSEFGAAKPHPPRTFVPVNPALSSIETYFNSPRHLLKSKNEEHNLTAQIVKLINSASSEILIATTRVRLVPIMNALRSASDRGVQVKILINQDDYHDLDRRAEWLLHNPNIQVRVKFFNLNPGDFLTYQMHNKWMVVDGRTLMTGSFNWSVSSENNHIENINVIHSEGAGSLMPAFLARFTRIWERGRYRIPILQDKLLADQSKAVIPKCGFEPISLSEGEVRQILSLAPRCAP